MRESENGRGRHRARADRLVCRPPLVVLALAAAVVAVTVLRVEAAGLPAAWVQALAVDPSDSTIVYAGTPVGLYKSTDAGESWTRIGMDLPYPDVTALAIDPAAPCTVYAGLDSHLESLVVIIPVPSIRVRNTRDILVRSADCGATWTLAPNWAGRGVHELAFTSAMPPQLFARVTVNAALGGVSPTLIDDIVHVGPSTATMVFSQPGFPVIGAKVKVATDPADPCGVYLAPAAYSHLYGTSSCTPSLGTWSSIGMPPANGEIRALAVHPLDHSVLVGTSELSCCASGGGLYRKTPTGAWTSVLSISQAINTIAFAPGNAYAVYAGSNDARVRKSTDGGLTWNPLRAFPGSISVIAGGSAPVLRMYAAGFGFVVQFGCHTGANVSETMVAPDCVFTDPLLTLGTTPIKAVHITELRERIDRLRARYAIPAFAWSDATLTAGETPIRAQHVLELRAALRSVYSAASRSAPTYTDADLGAGTISKGVHITQLRNAVEALE